MSTELLERVLTFLGKSNKNEEFPKIDKQFILDILKTIGTSETNRGKQKTETKITNKDIKDELKLFNDKLQGGSLSMTSVRIG
jgi:hypothetical protein